MALSRQERTRRKADLNPLEMIERVVSANDWPFDRTSDREIAVEVAGRWCDYRMFFSWLSGRLPQELREAGVDNPGGGTP